LDDDVRHTEPRQGGAAIRAIQHDETPVAGDRRDDGRILEKTIVLEPLRKRCGAAGVVLLV
jgi:hypothetical protein